MFLLKDAFFKKKKKKSRIHDLMNWPQKSTLIDSTYNSINLLFVIFICFIFKLLVIVAIVDIGGPTQYSLILYIKVVSLVHL